MARENIMALVFIVGLFVFALLFIPGMSKPTQGNVTEMAIVVVYEDGSTDTIKSDNIGLVELIRGKVHGLDALITSSGKKVKEITVTLYTRVRAETDKKIINAKWYCRGWFRIYYQYRTSTWIRVYETTILKFNSGDYPTSKLDGSEYTVFTRTYKSDAIISIIKDRIGGIPSGSRVRLEFLIPAYSEERGDWEGLKITAVLENGEELATYNNRNIEAIAKLTYSADRLILEYAGLKVEAK